MSNISYVPSNEDYFQLIETNENRINSSSRTSFEIFERQYDFIQSKNDNYQHDINSISNIKEDNSTKNENHHLKSENMEKNLNDNSKENCVKASENMCDVSSSMMRSISSIYCRLPFVSSYQMDKKERESSLKHLSSRKSLSNNCHRRSTITSLHLSDLNSNNNNLFNKINENIQDKYIDISKSHHSINLIKENSFNSIDKINKNLFNSNSDIDEYYKKGRTKIKLSLPIKPIKSLINDKFNDNNLNRYKEKEQRIKSIRSKSIQGEFTLPTNPPITVTIEPQSNINDNISNDNCFHDDQICSPENIHNQYQYQQRSTNDSPLKNSSTIVSYFMDLLKPSDNKLALKLFGSRKGLLKER
ncbi:unnamed protein product, partial [Rotaria sp. Silwood2]